jgi:hypothetical protein
MRGMYMKFDGSTYDPILDEKRLITLFDKVKKLMLDGRWRTLSEIHKAICAGSEASISARLRDLRKPRFGGFDVQRRRRDKAGSGIFEYRVVSVVKGQLSLLREGCDEEKIRD